MHIISHSSHFKTQDDLALARIKQSILTKMRHSFHVETVGDAVDTFTITAGGRRKFAGAVVCGMKLHMTIAQDDGCARIQMNGVVDITNSAKLMYCLGVLMVLLIGLFPGSIDTSSNGGPLDALVFLVIGGFIVCDVTQKLRETETLLANALAQVKTEFIHL